VGTTLQARSLRRSLIEAEYLGRDAIPSTSVCISASYLCTVYLQGSLIYLVGSTVALKPRGNPGKRPEDLEVLGCPCGLNPATAPVHALLRDCFLYRIRRMLYQLEAKEACLGCWSGLPSSHAGQVVPSRVRSDDHYSGF
jgi:hypothetical protein